MSRFHPRFALIVLLALLMSACEREAAPEPAATDEVATTDSERPAWNDFVDAYIEASLEAHPAWAVTQGRHEYDGQLPDWSREGIEKEIARMKAAREDAKTYPDEELTEQQRFQRDYFIARIDHDLFWLDKADWPFRNPQFYFGWMSDSLDPAPYITLNYAPLEQRMRAFTTYLQNIPRAAEQIRENLAMPMPRTWLQLGVDSFGGYADYFRDDVPGVFAEVDDEALQAEFAAANEAAIAAMDGLVEWLESNRATATDDFALGADLYRQMLWDTERVDIDLDRLEAIGRNDFERNRRALIEACAQFAPGDDVRTCFDKMAANKPADGPVEAARDHLVETKAFLVEQDLVSIPGNEEALVDESPPYARSNSAYINIPGPWEKNQPSTYYISPPNPAWPEDVQADFIPGEADLLGTSVHEVWPGHFLNFLHANRSPWIFGRAYVGYAFAEGWAHYTEEMMIEAGLRDGDPEAKIGQLSNALLRDARFISSIGLHTKGWTVEESKRFFMDEAFQSEGTAIQQSARGTYDPGYLNYTMGKLMIMELRDDWTATRGGRQAWRGFHDTFLSYGGPPIPLVRMHMMDEPEPRAEFPEFLDPQAGEDTASAGGDLSTWVFNCADGQQVVSTYENGDAWLYLPEGEVKLEQVPAASGTKYKGGGILYWEKGGELTLERAGVSTHCEVDRYESVWRDAAERGVVFRAVGNEPGWMVEIFSDQPSVLVTDYGQRRIEFDAEYVDGDGDALSVYRGQGDTESILVRLDPEPCVDDSGLHEFPYRVNVEVGAQELIGCGRELN